MLPPKSIHRAQGFTLLELTLVIGVLLALMSTGLFVSSAVDEWRTSKEATETLRSAYVAQRMYLSDHPTTSVTALSRDLILPYYPNRPSTFPQVEGLDGELRNIKVTVSPPVVVNADGSVYDPSGSTDDGVWDVGE
ncbi:type II secretory pathway pseudopilin PulG [Haloferula luteola]|uniref:Type II secretory pathway pseudopilin PulG n=1 Tax=Haloferula luteola TaxID=595692 RepID=A0A840V2Y7_9BACT|nr:type II secretion system protein [Haloferula luteola]MBB5352352.1 type II secretory pathway pseudopilin PulG [Haloferula luteola]